MKEESFAIHVDPWMHVVTAGGGMPFDELLPTPGRFHVTQLSGQEIPDEFSAFQNLQSSFQFPAYFGWNWNAVYDCLRDLKWLSADRHVLVVKSAEQHFPRMKLPAKSFSGPCGARGDDAPT
ncbi:barstar family protein [Streptomyces sp. NPDC013953]|uniref:barstar family protein n=1 Tax=Streptomyces sp. NPDC013953 TaxID=3364868 RepID=UPI003702DBAC